MISHHLSIKYFCTGARSQLLTGCLPSIQNSDPLFNVHEMRWLWRDKCDSVSDHLAQILDKMVQYKMGDRYQIAGDVIYALDSEGDLPKTKHIPVKETPDTFGKKVSSILIKIKNFLFQEISFPFNPSIPETENETDTVTTPISPTVKIPIPEVVESENDKQNGTKSPLIPLSKGGITGKTSSFSDDRQNDTSEVNQQNEEIIDSHNLEANNLEADNLEGNNLEANNLETNSLETNNLEGNNDAIIVRKTDEEEDSELKQKQEELKRLEVELAEKELELATLNGEIFSFKAEFYRVTGNQLLELQQIEAEIANLKAEIAKREAILNPDDTELKTKAEEAYEEAEAFKQEAEEFKQETEEYQQASSSRPTDSPFSLNFKPSKGLKKLFRQIAKLVHPDSNPDADEEEQEYRHEIMAEVNEAYNNQDEDRLNSILKRIQNNPNLLSDKGIGGKLSRILRKIKQISRRLTKIKQEIEILIQDHFYEMRNQAIEFEKEGRDFLREYVAGVEQDITEKKEELESLKVELESWKAKVGY